MAEAKGRKSGGPVSFAKTRPDSVDDARMRFSTGGGSDGAVGILGLPRKEMELKGGKGSGLQRVIRRRRYP